MSRGEKKHCEKKEHLVAALGLVVQWCYWCILYTVPIQFAFLIFKSSYACGSAVDWVCSQHSPPRTPCGECALHSWLTIAFTHSVNTKCMQAGQALQVWMPQAYRSCQINRCKAFPFHKRCFQRQGTVNVLQLLFHSNIAGGIKKATFTCFHNVPKL